MHAHVQIHMHAHAQRGMQLAHTAKQGTQLFYRTKDSEYSGRKVDAEEVVQADPSICEHDEGSAQGDALRDPQHRPQLTGMDLLLLHLHQHTHEGGEI